MDSIKKTFQLYVKGGDIQLYMGIVRSRALSFDKDDQDLIVTILIGFTQSDLEECLGIYNILDLISDDKLSSVIYFHAIMDQYGNAETILNNLSRERGDCVLNYLGIELDSYNPYKLMVIKFLRERNLNRILGEKLL